MESPGRSGPNSSEIHPWLLSEATPDGTDEPDRHLLDLLVLQECLVDTMGPSHHQLERVRTILGQAIEQRKLDLGIDPLQHPALNPETAP